MEPVYLDNSATTAVCPEAAEAAVRLMTEVYGNPSSLHTLGLRAEKERETARRRVAALLGCRPDTVYFTSGGTESNNLAVLGGAAAKIRAGRHIVTGETEHSSVREAVAQLEKQGFEVTRLVPGPNGDVAPRLLEEACRPDTVLVSLMTVNNETGAHNDIPALAAAARRAAPQALFHTDAVQAAGKLPLAAERWGVDLMSASAHKIHGPKGCGALYVRKGARILPRLFGGGQERGLRPGTEAMPLIAAFGAAAAALPPPAEQEARYRGLRQRLLDGLSMQDGARLLSPPQSVPYIVSIAVPGIRSETMLHFLADKGVYLSSGSACSRGRRSHVLEAMELPPSVVDSALRVSFTHTNTARDVERLLEALDEASRTLVRRRFKER